MTLITMMGPKAARSRRRAASWSSSTSGSDSNTGGSRRPAAVFLGRQPHQASGRSLNAMDLPALTPRGFWIRVIMISAGWSSLPSPYHHPQRRFGGRSLLNARPMIAARSS
jgi:hypothetical protein